MTPFDVLHALDDLPSKPDDAELLDREEALALEKMMRKLSPTPRET